MRRNFRVLGVVLMLILVVFVAVGFAEEKKNSVKGIELVTAVDELDCGQTKIVAETTCTADSKRPLIFMTCTSQVFSFKDMKSGGKVIKKVSNKNFDADEKVGKHIYAISTDWSCVNGKKGSYLFLEFNTGGNCDKCEWDEIYKMNGEKIASSRGKVTSKAHKNFEKVYKQLGFPEKWHDISFSRIKILKNQE